MPVTRRSSRRSSRDEDDQQNDDRGVKLGTGVGYDDVYAGGGDDDEYVSELPTMEEERNMLATAAAQDLEDLDEGRAASNHPSTLAAMQAAGKVRENRALK